MDSKEYMGICHAVMYSVGRKATEGCGSRYAGECRGVAKISNCAVSGNISGDSIGDTSTDYYQDHYQRCRLFSQAFVGGIVGASWGEIETCINEATVKGRGSQAYVGGIADRVLESCTNIDDSGWPAQIAVRPA